MLDKSNLVYDVIEGLIPDCTFLYESLSSRLQKPSLEICSARLFSGAKREIDLNEVRALMDSETYDFVLEAVDKRDLSDVVVNILGSLSDSGLATRLSRRFSTTPTFLEVLEKVS